jgi:hypothetical protein
MHDIVIGLVINILEFGLEVKGLFHRFRTWPDNVELNYRDYWSCIKSVNVL